MLGFWGLARVLGFGVHGFEAGFRVLRFMGELTKLSSPVLRPNLHSICAILQQTLNPKP